ncbi:MAG TPA: ABC transporter substrate-binding protein [Acetobacteraceae bacterium]|jgi:peptide/nickel transport system substrate-binding protein|nr:ABC transporter substrate-binding protein [Acetobacteraceae bacterium]
MRRRTLLQLGAAAAFAPAPVRAQSNDAIVLGMNRDIQGAIDPPSRLGSVEANILKAVCPGLIAFKPNSFDWQPALAKSVTQQGDTAIAFELQPGHQFTDGFGEVTANDVKFSFERFRKPGADGKLPAYADDWQTLDTVEVTGKYTGNIKLKSPAPMLWTTVLPDASGCIISSKALDQGAYRSDKQPVRVIGAGPYVFAQWTPNERVVLQANPQWPGPAPSFREITLRPIRDPKTAELALRANELQFTAIDPRNAAAIAKVANTRVLKHDSINMVWIGMNVEKKPFDDIRVRRAIAAAIDVGQVIEGAWNGTVAAADAPLAPGLLGYWPDAPKPKRDVAMAKRLLQEAGVSGLTAKLTLLNRPEYQSAGVIAQALAAEADIKLVLDVQEGGSFWSSGNGDTGKNLELALQRFGGKADPAFNMQWFTSSQIGVWNWQRWSDPEFDKLLSQAAATDDKDARQKMYVDAQRRMADSGAFIWLTHEVYAYGHRDTLIPAIEPNGDDWLIPAFSRA